MIPLFKVTMSPQVNEELEKVLHSGFIGQGVKVREFEELLNKTFGWENTLAVNSGTSALQLALHLVKSYDGESVLLPPLSCFASTSAVIANNMVPRWVDIDPKTLLMNLTHLESKLDKDTRVILIVHFAGRTPDYNRLNSILDKHQLKFGFRPIVIEDCAQSLGSVTNIHEFGGSVGLSGNICCFSFQAVKTLTTGDGGAIVLPNKELYERAKKLRWYGYDRDLSIKNQSISESGFKYHMNDINATIGICNLKYLKDKDIFGQQMENYGLLLDEFNINDYGVPCNGQFPVIIRKSLFDKLTEKMSQNGIECSPAHFRCDKHYCVKKYRAALPGMDYVESRMTMLPCGWWVNDIELERIISIVKSINKVSWKRGF